jgi:uncharacterized membrane protein
MSKLRDFISENRRRFDDELPPGSAWDKIEAGLTAREKKKNWSIRPAIWIAAASVIIIISLTWYIVPAKDTQPAAAPTAVQTEESEFSMEARKMFLQISEQQRQLKRLGADAPELYRRFQTDLNGLDSMYAELEKQAAASPDPDMILAAMMQNLEVQASLLKKQLQILNDYNKNQNIKNEKTNLRTT